MNKLFTLLLALIASNSMAQSVISGRIIDGDFNDALPFANVILTVDETGEKIGGTTTDFEGNFSFEVISGTYALEVSFVGYGTKKINDINVGDNDENIVNIILLPASDSLDEVVVTTSARSNTEASVLSIQKASVNLIDGLSSQSIRKSGDSNLASAIKRVPGV